MRTNQFAAVATMIATAALMSGCRIESDKHDGNDNVKIATPFGGMTVKTNDDAVGGLGLPVLSGCGVGEEGQEQWSCGCEYELRKLSATGEGGELSDAG